MAVVVQLSDLHLVAEPDRRDRCASASVEAVLAALGGVRPDLVVLTGDLTDDGSLEGCERLAATVAPLGAPVLALAGNHDAPSTVSAAFGEAGTVLVDRWRVVPLPTFVAGEVHGRANPAGAAELLDADPHRSTFVVLHHPPRSPSTHPYFVLEQADELMEVIVARPWVRAVAGGHLHEALASTEAHVALVVAPSTWYAIRHDGPAYHHDVADGMVGAVIWELHDDGSFEHRFVPRPAVS